MKYSFEDKYNFLLSFFEVKDVDTYEQDALLTCTNSAHYFQFYTAEQMHDKNYAVEWMMRDRGVGE